MSPWVNDPNFCLIFLADDLRMRGLFSGLISLLAKVGNATLCE